MDEKSIVEIKAALFDLQQEIKKLTQQGQQLLMILKAKLESEAKNGK